jgi:SsrA-binding protein
MVGTMAKEKGRKLIAQNKKARHDYHILDTYEAGLVLTGTEVKSLRQGRASLVDGFVQLDGHEAWLHNVHVPEYSQGTWTNHSARRKRKLLLHRVEIDKLESKSQETGHTIVPLALYFKDGRAKIEIALARGKKEYDKRQTLREKQDRREAERAMSAVRRKQRALGTAPRPGEYAGKDVRWSRTMAPAPRGRCTDPLRILRFAGSIPGGA